MSTAPKTTKPKSTEHTFSSAHEALRYVRNRGWYVVQHGRDMVPPAHMHWASRVADLPYYPNQGRYWEPAKVRRWHWTRTYSRGSPGVFCGELELSDGSTLPLAKLDPKRDNHLMQREGL